MASNQQRDAHDLKIKTRVDLSEGETMLDSMQKCDLCKTKASKYTCPKCSLRYCGIDCYKGENHRKCSEEFYKEQVLRELEHMKSTDGDKKRTMEILKRVMQCEKNVDYVWSDNEAIENLAKRMEDIDLETASFDEMYGRLTEKERRLFESVVQSGEIEILDVCTPWWAHDRRNNGIREFHDSKKGSEGKDEEKEDTINDQDVPQLIKDIPPLNALLPNKRPSEKLPYSIIELITIYCFLYRVYNAEFKESLLEVVNSFTTLSPVLSDSHYYEDLEACILSLVQRIKISPAFKDNVDPIRISLSDLKQIVSSKFPKVGCIDDVPMSLLCICDLHSLFKNGLMEIKALKEKTKEMKERKILYHRITKKLLFMASWLSGNNEVLKCISKDIEALQKKLCTYWDSVHEDKKIIEQNIWRLHEKKKSRLIEEL